VIWIANSRDGAGASYYTFGDRHQEGLSRYFETALKCFRSLAAICNRETVLVQLVAFSEAHELLPRYMEVMQAAGWQPIESETNGAWRKVPNRKWYACINSDSGSSNEVVLVHRVQR
jgi:hypothetical protein